MLVNIKFRVQWHAVLNCSQVNLGGSFYYLNINKGYKKLWSQRGPFRVSSNDLILFGLSVQNDSCGRVLFCEFQKKSNSWSLLRACYIPSRPFWYVWISRMFGWAMILILARRSQAKLPMTGSDEPDMPPTPTKKVRLGIYRTPIQQISMQFSG